MRSDHLHAAEDLSNSFLDSRDRRGHARLPQLLKRDQIGEEVLVELQ